MMTTHFKQMLLNRIEKKNVLLGMHQQFQDLHWDSSDKREVCPCMQEIFGKNVTTINFIQEIVNKEFYLPELQNSFEDFLRNGGVFDCSWSDDYND